MIRAPCERHQSRATVARRKPQVFARAASGTVVSGNLYVDDAVDHLPISGSESADELAAFPYEYTVGA
jgi:hypothetical protein